MQLLDYLDGALLIWLVVYCKLILGPILSYYIVSCNHNLYRHVCTYSILAILTLFI